MTPLRNRRLLAAIIVTLVIMAGILPAFVAHRYTSPEQRGEFLRRGWAFAYTALAVPGSAQLKTSGMALRKAEWLSKGTAIDPQEIRLQFTTQDAPLTFSHKIGARSTTSVTTSCPRSWLGALGRPCPQPIRRALTREEA